MKNLVYGESGISLLPKKRMSRERLEAMAKIVMDPRDDPLVDWRAIAEELIQELSLILRS